MIWLLFSLTFFTSFCIPFRLAGVIWSMMLTCTYLMLVFDDLVFFLLSYEYVDQDTYMLHTWKIPSNKRVPEPLCPQLSSGRWSKLSTSKSPTGRWRAVRIGFTVFFPSCFIPHHKEGKMA